MNHSNLALELLNSCAKYELILGTKFEQINKSPRKMVFM